MAWSIACGSLTFVFIRQDVSAYSVCLCVCACVLVCVWFVGPALPVLYASALAFLSLLDGICQPWLHAGSTISPAPGSSLQIAANCFTDNKTVSPLGACFSGHFKERDLWTCQRARTRHPGMCASTLALNVKMSRSPISTVVFRFHVAEVQVYRQTLDILPGPCLLISIVFVVFLSTLLLYKVRLFYWV